MWVYLNFFFRIARDKEARARSRSIPTSPVYNLVNKRRLFYSDIVVDKKNTYHEQKFKYWLLINVFVITSSDFTYHYYIHRYYIDSNIIPLTVGAENILKSI